MSDPLGVLPFALAAGGGRIDGHEVARVVTAGLALLQRSVPLVRALAGRRAAVLLPTSHRFITALAASEGRGAVLVNPLAAPLEIAFQLADADVGAVFTNAALAGRLAANTPHVLLDEAPDRATVVIGGTSTVVDLHVATAIRLDGDPDTAGRDEEAAIVYTSAMRGVPLGAVNTHRNLIANGRATVIAAGQVREDHVLAALPFSHLFGLTVTATSPLLAGARVTTMERFHPIKAIEILETQGVTEFVGVPSVFAAMTTLLERRGGRLAGDTLRLCICGGAALPVELQERWLALTGVELRQGYGLTEAGPVCLFNRVDLPNRRGTLGVPFPGVEVSVRRPLSDAVFVGGGPPALGASPTDAVAAGEPGEICVRGDNVGPGYLGGNVAGLPRRGGWLYTGDRGRLNADGSVTFLGLLKPMFTRNGFNVYPAEVERALGELPGVERARAFAIPEPSRENDVGAEVTGAVDEAAVRSWAERRLSQYKQPSRVDVRR